MQELGLVGRRREKEWEILFLIFAELIWPCGVVYYISYIVHPVAKRSNA